MSTWLTFVFCTEAGALASWGGAEFGQLGFEGGDLVDGVQPRFVKGSQELHFARVAAGAAHTLALTGAVPFTLYLVFNFGKHGLLSLIAHRKRGCLLVRTGSFWCFGTWESGQLQYTHSC